MTSLDRRNTLPLVRWAERSTLCDLSAPPHWVVGQSEICSSGQRRKRIKISIRRAIAQNSKW